MATFKYIIVSLGLALLSLSAVASTTEWLNLTNSNHITAIVQHGNTLWVGSRGGGLAKIDLATGSKTFYNKANSGLPSNQIEAIQVDQQNTVWIGTYDQGLVRFDGRQLWEVISHDGTGISVRTDIYDMKLDENGDLWIGTLFSLLKYDGSTFTDYPLPGYTAASAILVLAPNDIYMAWGGNGGFVSPLMHFDGTEVDTVPGMGLDGIYQLHLDGQDRIWACYNGGIALKNGNSWTKFDSTNSAITNKQARSLVEWNGTLALGTDDGIFTYNGTTWVTSNISQKNINKLAVTNNGELYVGTMDAGLFKTNGNLLQRVQASNSMIPTNQLSGGFNKGGELVFRNSLGASLITFANGVWGANGFAGTASGSPAMVLAPDNSIWLCDYNNLYHLTGSNLQTWKLADYGIPSAGISAMEVSPSGTVYVGTYTLGFFTFDGLTFKRYTRANSTLSSDRITSFAFPNAAILIGTNVDVAQGVNYGGGIEVFNGNTFSLIHPDNSDLQSKYISDIIQHGDSLWIGGDGGFSLLHNGVYTNYLYNNGSGCPLTFIKHMAINSKGEVYATGYNIDSEAIMVKWDGSTFEVFDASNTPITEFAFNLHHMLFDDYDNLWLLHGSGVFIYKEGGITNVNEDLASGILSPKQANTVKLYPNPVTTNFTIQIPQAGGNITIFNMMGAKIYGTTITETELTIDASEWPKGIYLYQIQTTVGFESGKFLVR